MAINFFESDVINISDTETGLQMLDKLSRIKEGRRIEPLDALDNVFYPHRYLYDNYNLQIGDTYFMIPPEFIKVDSEATSQSVVTLRQENTQRMKAGHHKRTIYIDLVFNGIEQINGYPVPGPEGTYYVDGLRQLLAQFKCTPFLPISNEMINGMYSIFTVVLQSINITTMQGYPDVLMAQITLQEVNMYPYIEMPDVCFKYMIDWDLFRFYYQRMLTESHVYKRLQSLDANSTHDSFKISILDESVFSSPLATKTNMLDIICDNVKVKTDENGVVAKTNYTTWLDSHESDVVITGFQCGYYNLLTNMQLSDISTPTVQFLGGLDTMYVISFETTDYSVVQALEQCQISNDLLVRNNIKMHSVGFIKLESELVAFTGSLFVMIDYVSTSTVAGFPGLYKIEMRCMSYDIAQSEREDLHGFRPFKDCPDCDYGTSPTCEHYEQSIEQSMEGLKVKIMQDNFAEWKIRSTMEVYPDLHLPTYSEVNTFIDKCAAFRKAQGLSELPYKEYPTNPTALLHGISPDNNIKVNRIEHGIAYTNSITGLDKEAFEYNVYVDPDFYVFYPCSYLSFHLESLANGEGDYYGYSPKQRKAFVSHMVETRRPKSVSEAGLKDSNSELIEEFIGEAKQYIGCAYVYGTAGEPDIYGNPTFDCSGFITHLLKQIGVMPMSEGRLTVASITSNPMFEEVPVNQKRRGDLLLTMTPRPHVVIYEGGNNIIHASNSAPYPQGGVKQGTVYFTDRCFRVKAFIDNTPLFVNTTGFYVTNEFLDMVKQWEGFLGTAEPRDGGMDIGYGFHNEYFDGTKQVKVVAGMTMTRAEADKYLRIEMEDLLPKTLQKLTANGWDPQQFTNNQVLALTSYFYNRGYHNKNADAILVASKTVEEIGNNLPSYWGAASYAKQGLINRRLKEQNLFFSESKQGTTTYTLTSAELDSICRTIMAETQGEPPEAEMAMAQVIYDRLTHPTKKFGGLSNILNSSAQFKSPYTGALNSTVKKSVERVFCNNDKYWPNYQAWYFLTPDATRATFQQRDEQYTRLDEIGKHLYWGEKTKGSTITYTIVNTEETGSASSNEYKKAWDAAHNAQTVKDISRFAEPVLVQTDAIIYDDTWTFWKDENGKAKTNAKKYLNDGLNIFNTSFCDEYQYSARGRLVKAFPTYLFCVLDDDAQWYDGRKLWTNYYVHRALIDVSTHATNDMPTETAHITISNVYHNLSRTQGGLNYSILNDDAYPQWKRNFYQFTGLMLDPTGPKITKNLLRLRQIIYDNAKLREGARIHLRMGYGSDPLSLAPIINGHISAISLGDQITMVVTSDGHELIQHVTSAKEKDTNNGIFGLFGLGEDQEASNIIAEIMAKRQNGLMNRINKNWAEGSAYSIEHFGLYFNQKFMTILASVSGVGTGIAGGFLGASAGSAGAAALAAKFGAGIGTAIIPGLGTILGATLGAILGVGVGTVVGALLSSSDVGIPDLWNGVQEQYDLLKNIYKADYGAEHYIYSDFLIDGEQNFVFNKYNMTPWDVFQLSAQQAPEYIVKASTHQFDSRLYFGVPFWMEKYRYDYFGGQASSADRKTIFEECKTAAQVHILDCANIIDNQVQVSSKFSNTNIKVMYGRGHSTATTQTIHSDDTIDFAYQKTTILDSPIVQNAFGPDALYEILQYDLGEASARRVGISNLLYGWQQQYQGQIILMGCPGIKPHDYLMIHDSFANFYGVAIAREVTHSFSINTGFTTSVTLGMVGFSTDADYSKGNFSGMIVTCQNLLSVLNCFSSYIEARRQLRNNYEQYLNIFANFEILRDKVTTAVATSQMRQNHSLGWGIVGNAGHAVNIVRILHGYKYGKASFFISKKLKDTGKAVNVINEFRKGYQAYRKIDDAVDGIKGIKNVFGAIKQGTIVAAGAPSGGIGSLVVAAVWLLVDILLDEVFEWFENKNVCMLLPVWWNGYPFVAGVKNGQNILLINYNDIVTEKDDTGTSYFDD